ncbi:MAG: RHS repeat protein [Acidobacteria bacterium]|nr:RHS repeat protein [Acidobacteriota bacterium]
MNVGLPSSNLTPTSGSWFDAATNRISGGVPDGRGNQTLVSPFTVSYDGENRVTAVTSVENGSGSYEYDGEGRRVRKLRHKLFLLPGELIRPQNRPVLRLRQSSMLQALADDILRKIATLKPLPP